jgi:DNA-binding IclR family transcriptional regulator
MSRTSPAVGRVTAILNFLARHPRESFTLSEIARQLDLSPATAHGQLNALVAAGFLLREPGSRRYTLGPALIEIGTAAALRQGDVIEYARPELIALGEHLGQQCVATQVVGDQIVFLARSAPVDSLGITIAVGHRVPFAPPLGTVFVAWSDEDDIAAWLTGVSPEADPDAVAQCVVAMARVRERGYSAGLNVDLAHRRLWGAVGTDAGSLTELLEAHYFLEDIRDDASYRLRHIGAPVFDSTGRVVIALSAVYFGEARSGAELRSEATAVAAAADRVTATIRGRRPEFR